MTKIIKENRNSAPLLFIAPTSAATVIFLDKRTDEQQVKRVRYWYKKMFLHFRLGALRMSTGSSFLPQLVATLGATLGAFTLGNVIAWPSTALPGIDEDTELNITENGRTQTVGIFMIGAALVPFFVGDWFLIYQLSHLICPQHLLSHELERNGSSSFSLSPVWGDGSSSSLLPIQPCCWSAGSAPASVQEPMSW